MNEKNPKPEWYKDDANLWCHPEYPIAVSKESDGLWHAIVTSSDDETNTFGHKNISDAFNEAEARWKL